MASRPPAGGPDIAGACHEGRRAAVEAALLRLSDAPGAAGARGALLAHAGTSPITLKSVLDVLCGSRGGPSGAGGWLGSLAAMLQLLDDSEECVRWVNHTDRAGLSALHSLAMGKAAKPGRPVDRGSEQQTLAASISLLCHGADATARPPVRAARPARAPACPALRPNPWRVCSRSHTRARRPRRRTSRRWPCTCARAATATTAR